MNYKDLLNFKPGMACFLYFYLKNKYNIKLFSLILKKYIGDHAVIFVVEKCDNVDIGCDNEMLIKKSFNIK